MFTGSIKKPEQWITCRFQGNQKMTFAGSTEPCAHVTVMSIGNLGNDENIRIASEVGDFIESELGIPKNRAYIRFDDAPKYEVGWNGTTFGTIL